MNRIIFVILALVITGSGIYFFLFRTKTTAVQPGMQFHPDAVVELSLVADGKEFSFKRGSRAEDWMPQGAGPQIQSILNALTGSATQKSNPPGHATLSLKITFSDHNSWNGIFDGRSIYWQTGALAGQHTIENANIIQNLLQVRFLFDEKKINWCLSRPKELTLLEGGKTYDIQKKTGVWASKSSRPLDQNVVEKWLSHFCEIQVDFYSIPDHLASHFQTDDMKFEVLFENNQKLEMTKSKAIWKYDKRLGFESKQWDQALLDFKRWTSLK